MAQFKVVAYETQRFILTVEADTAERAVFMANNYYDTSDFRQDYSDGSYCFEVQSAEPVEKSEKEK